jgi:ABC-2 type transport system permease protein
MVLGFIVNALILRFGWSIQEMAWAIVAIVQPLSCVLYPLTSLPTWMQRISLMLPSTYVFEEMRRIMAYGVVDFKNLIISFLMNVVYLFLSLIFFKVMFEQARIHGRLVKLS